MWKKRLRKIYAHLFQWLTLTFVDTNMKNCRHWNLKGILASDGLCDNPGMLTFFPMLSPVMTLASRTYMPILVTTNLVPLHKPAVGSRFLINIIGTSTFNLILWFGIPVAVIVFKNSGVYTSSDLLTIELLERGESQLQQGLKTWHTHWFPQVLHFWELI